MLQSQSLIIQSISSQAFAGELLPDVEPGSSRCIRHPQWYQGIKLGLDTDRISYLREMAMAANTVDPKVVMHRYPKYSPKVCVATYLSQ